MEIKRETMKKIMVIILYTVVLLGLAMRFEKVAAAVSWVLGLLFPFFLGGAIAFIVNVPMRGVEKLLSGTGAQKGKKKRFLRPASLCVTLLLIVLVMGVVFFLVVPQITETVVSLADVIPAFILRIRNGLMGIFTAYPDITEYLSSVEVSIDWKSTIEKMVGFVTTGAGSVLSSTVTAAVSIASALTTFGIAFIFAIYILLQKEKLGGQFKKLFYAYLPKKCADETLRILAIAEHTFSRFLAGQCMEAVILGTMFFAVLALLRMPYPLLIGVLIAFTALIPVFGAFIGCAVGIFLMLMVSPVKAFWFVCIFLLLQQIEGNLIYPHVVGNSVGLPSIWVLAAVSIGGSMMGIVGMLIFIPLCSVCYTLLREDVNRRLRTEK